MKAINKILEALGEGEGKKSKVIILTEGADSENDSDKTEVTKVTIKDSTRAAKIAKMKCMIFILEQAKGLSGDEANDILGSVGHLAEFSRKPFDLDNDLGMLLLKKSEENTRRLLAELESDESKGD